MSTSWRRSKSTWSPKGMTCCGTARASLSTRRRSASASVTASSASWPTSGSAVRRPAPPSMDQPPAAAHRHPTALSAPRLRPFGWARTAPRPEPSARTRPVAAARALRPNRPPCRASARPRPCCRRHPPYLPSGARWRGHLHPTRRGGRRRGAPADPGRRGGGLRHPARRRPPRHAQRRQRQLCTAAAAHTRAPPRLPRDGGGPAAAGSWCRPGCLALTRLAKGAAAVSPSPSPLSSATLP